MHEISVAQAVLEAAEREVREHGGGLIRRVRCRVGVLQQIVPELLSEAFGCVVERSRHRGAGIDVDKAPVTIDCATCGHQSVSEDWRVTCPECDSFEVRITGGDELELTGITLERTSGDSGSS
ncbi:MAG: hydrogenase maturation nickel metallochaperone HypA [Phycisphaerae bacterium]|nr:hydrogenase maturation nickel metallochaperone HypA [Phycisphaerae bacterium]